MTRDEVILGNDLLRTQFRGGMALMTPSVFFPPTELRMRALLRISQAQQFTLDDRGEGVFAYADILFHWYIGAFAGAMYHGRHWRVQSSVDCSVPLDINPPLPRSRCIQTDRAC